MRAAVYHGPRDISVEEVPDATIESPDDILVKMITASMCGSDLYLFNGEVEELVQPGHTTLGHEVCGEVIEAGSAVTLFAVGDRVTFPYSVSCGACVSCAAGQTAHCLVSGKAIYGFGTAFGDLGGSHAEFVRVPMADAHAEHVPASVSDEFTPLLSCNLPAAIIAVEGAEIGSNDSVALIGCGPTGLLALQLARACTAGPIFAFDPVDSRRDLAATLGATPIPSGPDDMEQAVSAVLEATSGVGVDKIIEFAGRGPALSLAVTLARPGGTISGGGVFLEREYPVSLFDLYFKNLRLNLNGFANAKTAMAKAVRAIEEGHVDPTVVMSHHVTLAELPSAAVRFADHEPGFLKMLITP